MSWRGMVGEPLALDLVNTTMDSPQGEVELLDSEQALREWIAAEGERLGPLAGDVDAAPGVALDVEAVRDLRGFVTDAVEKARLGETPLERALRAITDAQPRRRPTWRWAGSTAP